ncbi:restriction endonuclease subunit S [Aeromonas veronii]
MTWPMVKFHELISSDGLFTDGDWVESKDQDPNGNVRLIQLADIGLGYFTNKSDRYLTKEKALELNCTFLNSGDILIARMPDPIGRACIFPQLHKECVTVVDICVVRPKNENVDSKWLMHCINSREFNNQVLNYVTGTTRQRISRGNLSNLNIALPPLKEQKRIAAILDKADAIRQKRQQAIALADDFLRSVFLDMFGDPITNPKGWDLSTIGKLGNVITGSTPSSKKTGMFDGDIPFVTPGDLETDAPVSRTLTDEGALNSRTCRKGTTLVCCIGATIGKIGIASRTSAFNQQINAIEWGSEIDDEFGFFAMKLMKATIISSAIQTTLPILNKSAFSALAMYLPPKDLQIKFSKIYKSTYQLNGVNKKFTINSNILFDSLLQKSFSGQL